MINVTSFFLQFLSLIVILNISIFSSYSQKPIIFSDIESVIKIGSNSAIFEDTLSNTMVDDVLKNPFVLSTNDVLNLNVSKSTFWIKFKIENKTNINNLLLHITNPMIDEIILYSIKNQNIEQQEIITCNLPIYKRKYNHQDFIFDLNITSNTSSEFVLSVKSSKMIILPISIGTQKIIDRNIQTKDLIFGVFFGIMLAMFLYNLFIYFIIKDKSYLYYITYILIVALTQLSFQGYTSRYFWSENQWLIKHSFFILSILVGVSAGEFIKYFLNIKKYSILLNRGFYIFYILYLLGFILMINKSYTLSHKIIDITALTISLYILYTAIVIMRKGNRSAIILLISWSFFLVGVTIFALKNFGILPYNNYTEFTMPIGAAIETVLLSFALAARINDYKKEKEYSQLQAFQALEEKETFVREQNVTLENKVIERTQELNTTLDNLKETQSQLVDAEKMASLGQLTAGVAHEINNPINFVSSNISPLKQDINDLKKIIDKYSEINSTNINEKLKEIESLKKELDYNFLTEELETIIASIENGANRTTEIVRSLRNFSRLDESDLIPADINEGIDSALILLRSEFTDIKVKKELSELPKIECYPGKLNQVFLNILNNAIHAIRDRKNQTEKGMITISTAETNDTIAISIKDNGTGISSDILDKIFNPFFTTKEVGKGTGLGLSIVYRIIDSHNGTIKVESAENIGTTFTLNLPKHQKQ